MTKIKIGRLSFELNDVIIEDNGTNASTGMNPESDVQNAEVDADTQNLGSDVQNAEADADTQNFESDAQSAEANAEAKNSITLTVDNGATRSFTLNISPDLLTAFLNGIMPN